MDADIQDKAAQIKYQNESMQTMQATLDQFKDKCFYLEQELSSKVQENEYLKQDLEKYEVEFLSGAAHGEQGSTKNGALGVTAIRVEAE